MLIWEFSPKYSTKDKVRGLSHNLLPKSSNFQLNDIDLKKVYSYVKFSQEFKSVIENAKSLTVELLQ